LACLLEWLRTRVYAKLPRAPRCAAVIVALLVIAGPAVQAASHWQRCNYSNYWYARDHAENLLRCMMRGALAFPIGDYNTFPLVYLTMVEGRRPDVLLAAYSGHIRPELYAERPPDSPEPVLSWLIKHARRPFYCTMEQPSPLHPATFVPAGLLYYLKPPHVTFSGAGLVEACDYRNLREPTVQDLGARMIMIHYQLSKGQDELARGDRAAGLESVRAAVQLGCELKGVLNKAGAILFTHGVVDEAAGYFARALELDPRYTEPHWNLFQLHKQQTRWADARQQLLALLALDPQDARACEEMGFLLHEHLNDTADAVRYWRAALQRNPRLPRARQMLEQLEAGPGG
jgi:tetratricopeptide (TPR) repeat protein